NLSAAAVSTSQINLAWTSNSVNQTSFKVEQSTDGSNFTQIATVAANVTTYNNTGLSSEEHHVGRVRASSVLGASDYSNAASDITAAPAAPTNLTATAASTSEIDLAWTNHALNHTCFKIEQSTDGSSFTQIGTVAANATSYNNTGL